MVDCFVLIRSLGNCLFNCDERHPEFRQCKSYLASVFVTFSLLKAFLVLTTIFNWLLFAWLWLCEQVVYFTSLFPYIVLTIFFIRGITLKGAGAGLVHMYTPKVEKLLQPMVWLDAATQVFYSFGLAFGSLIAFGSYNTPKNNCVRDVLLVSFCNAFTAIYASVVIFSILGFKATIDSERCIEKWV